MSPMQRLLGNHYAETSTHYFTASHQRALSDVWLPVRLVTRARQKVRPAGRHGSSLITLRLSSVLRPGRKKGLQCSKTSFFSFLPRWHLRFCGGAADLRFVGGVDHV